MVIKTKDCLGNELYVGDKVIASHMHYADLLIGEIVEFTPKKARIRYVRSQYPLRRPETQLKESYQLCRISECEEKKHE